jgi:hypothetical protein
MKRQHPSDACVSNAFETAKLDFTEFLEELVPTRGIEPRTY